MRGALAVSKPFAVAGALLAGLALSACTSTGGTTTARVEGNSAATAEVAYPRLPDSVLTVPAAYAPDEPAGGAIAEATATYAVAAATPAQTDAATSAAESAPSAQQVADAPAASDEQPVVVASAVSEDDESAVFVPASYAGSTPNAARLAIQTPEAQNPMLIHAPDGRYGPSDVGARSPELDALMAKYAEHYEIPEELVRRVARRESTFNPAARNGPYLGLMQISHATAKGMGYRGAASGLLDAETNLKYAVRYLRGAWLVAKGNLGVADKLYQRGYYYDAKRAGLLDETGLGKDRRRRNPS